ncbi:MAG TPA: D-arabinono-1,4-lactone oxidase [Myxococcota bacterium]|nr:D-arabinono-1,4-lactone oxidase [Myxococcota bacterium]
MRARGLTRRELLRGALAAGLGGAALAACSRANERPAQPSDWAPGRPLPWRNWSGLETCVPAARAAPGSEAEVAALLRSASGAVRPAGAGHSFSALVPSDGTLVFLDALTGVVSADAATSSAEVWAGTRLSQLGLALAALGQAMPNLPDIEYQTLGGAIATSTHGTGATLGSLASCVTALTLATPAGELLECDASRNTEVFHAARTSLGALGVVTRVRLANRAAFQALERTRFVELDALLADLPRLRDENRHFEFYAFPHASVALAIDTNESSEPPRKVGDDDPEAVYLLRTLFRLTRRVPVFGERMYDAFLRSQPPTEHLDTSWSVLAHPRTVPFNEMEYTLPAEQGPACLREVLTEIRARDLDSCFPIECRFVRRDDVWLSMFHERDGFTISIHQYVDQDWRPYFAALEPIFWKHGGRPHWGKLHSLDAPRLAALYPRWAAFQKVRRALDPGGRLANAHLARVLGT